MIQILSEIGHLLTDGVTRDGREAFGDDPRGLSGGMGIDGGDECVFRHRVVNE